MSIARKILYLNSTSGYGSITASLGRRFVNRYMQHVPDIELKSVDLWSSELERFDLARAEASYRISNGKGTESDKKLTKPIYDMARELLSMDLVLIACPVWNYSVPFVLKQYIDCVIQPGLSFRVQDDKQTKPVVLISSAGGQMTPENDHMSPLIRDVFQLVGFQDFYHIQIQKSTQSDAESIIVGAQEQVDKTIEGILLKYDESVCLYEKEVEKHEIG